MELRTYIENYIQQSLRKRGKLELAAKVSADEIVSRIEDFAANPSPQNFIILLRGLTTSGIYISRSFLSFLVTHVQISNEIVPPLTESERFILDQVYGGIPIDTHAASSAEIFSAIYNDLLIKHRDPNFDPRGLIKKFDATLVLVSGVLNEIFSTAAFERGAKHLSKVLGIHYICPKVHGTKSVRVNSKLIEEQLKSYCNENPNEKLWLLAFSKGGIDCLHFLSKNSEFASKNIIGLSNIASPILGTGHLNHKLLKLVNSLHDYSDSQLYKFLEKKSDFLFKDFQKSLSKEHQKNWFYNNHEKLPHLDFYTALALESSWTESHFWMILTKAFFQNKNLNDGIVEAENALYPTYFEAHNLGIIKGHHLIGTRSSTYNQEALLEAHVIYLQYFNLLN